MAARAPWYLDPNNRPELKALRSNLKTQKGAGFLTIDIDVPKLADLSLVEEAAKRIKQGGLRFRCCNAAVHFSS